ncbi:MAG: hypothetical protein ACD_62C00216G0003 [uncultured bacterium]|nr:MAG: hypothetical protein ACD_62C00216G0003 [uncultured bacterium]
MGRVNAVNGDGTGEDIIARPARVEQGHVDSQIFCFPQHGICHQNAGPPVWSANQVILRMSHNCLFELGQGGSELVILWHDSRVFLNHFNEGVLINQG